jgi:YHS domain-containing protein
MPKILRKPPEIAIHPAHLRYVRGMLQTRFVLALAAASLAGLFAQFSAAGAAELPLAIRGYDPVAYFTLQRATPGDARFEYSWDEHRWQFASARNRELFKSDPVRYAPQFANFCAVALARGEVLAANPEYWLISDGKLYLFGKAAGPELFRKDPAGSVEKANRNRGLLKAH